MIITKNFSRDIKFGKGAEILFMVNSANNFLATRHFQPCKKLIKLFRLPSRRNYLKGQKFLPNAAMSAAYPIRLGVRIIGNPTAGYSPFILSGLMLNGLQIGIIVIILPIFNAEYTRRKFSKFHEKILLAAKLLPYEIISLCGYLI